MKEILEQKNSFYIRMKYLIYYFVVSSLESLVRFSEQNKIFCTGVNQYLNEIGNMKSLRNEKFCSCMRHYGITEADLPNNYINLNEPLVGLIQAHFKIDSLEFINQLDMHLISQSEMLSEWVLKS